MWQFALPAPVLLVAMGALTFLLAAWLDARFPRLRPKGFAGLIGGAIVMHFAIDLLHPEAGAGVEWLVMQAYPVLTFSFLVCIWWIRWFMSVYDEHRV